MTEPPVTRIGVARRLVTAHAVERDALAERSTLRLAAAGLAVRHFIEPLRPYLRMRRSDEFVVATIATKQIEHLLATAPSDPLRSLGAMLTDPTRPALPNGATARSLVGTEWWDDFARDVTAIVASAQAFAKSEGVSELLRLSGWYARSDPAPWWGTPEWTARVDLVGSTTTAATVMSQVLAAEPELVDTLTLTRVLVLDRRPTVDAA